VAKKKLQRFKENELFSNLFQYDYSSIKNNLFPLKGEWNENYFKNNNPIIIELGCGKGEYTTGLSELYPNKNFIGFDRQGARLWRGCKTAIEKNLKNVAFVRTNIQFIDNFFSKNEVDEIWITFPDPQPIKFKKRLTSSIYLNRYSKFLKPNGIINLKTDSQFFFDSTIDVIEAENHKILFRTNDLYSTEINEDVSKIKTFYEKMWLEQGLKINYLKFQLNE